MSPREFRVLIEELKNILKTRKMTYQDLANEIGMSEAGVKRIFGSNDIKLSTLSKVCEALGFSFIDLVASSKVSQKKVNFFSEEQEAELANHFELYIFFNELIIRKKSVSQIKKDHLLTDANAERFLLRLEKLEILRRTASGQIRALLRSPIGLRAGGPLRKKLQDRFARGLVTKALSAQTRPGTSLETREWTMSVESVRRFQLDLKTLIESYDQISARDESVLSHEELTTLSLAVCLSQESPYGPLRTTK